MLIRRYYKTGMGFVATLNQVSRSAVIVIHEADLWVKFLPELYPPLTLSINYYTHRVIKDDLELNFEVKS